MSLSQISANVLQRIDDDLTLPDGRAFPNVDFDPKDVTADNFIGVDILPATTLSPAIESSSYKRETGIVQITVYTRAGKGMIKGANIVDDIVALFPRGLVLDGTIEFNGEPSTAPGFNDGQGWFNIPVSIPYSQIVN